MLSLHSKTLVIAECITYTKIHACTPYGKNSITVERRFEPKIREHLRFNELMNENETPPKLEEIEILRERRATKAGPAHKKRTKLEK